MQRDTTFEIRSGVTERESGITMHQKIACAALQNKSDRLLEVTISLCPDVRHLPEQQELSSTELWLPLLQKSGCPLLKILRFAELSEQPGLQRIPFIL